MTGGIVGARNSITSCKEILSLESLSAMNTGKLNTEMEERISHFTLPIF